MQGTRPLRGMRQRGAESVERHGICSKRLAAGEILVDGQASPPVACSARGSKGSCCGLRRGEKLPEMKAKLPVGGFGRLGF